MRKIVLGFIIALMFAGLAFSGTERFGVNASTSAIGIIYQDITWTVAGSPCLLTGPLAVNASVTLTIQPGVVVNLDGYYIQVNGTLVAIGTSADKIQFTNGELNFNKIEAA